MITLVEPSPKSQQRFRDEVRGLTARWTHCVPQEDIVERVNRYVSGWVNYFHLHNSTQVFTRQRFFLEQRMRTCRSVGSVKAMELCDGRRRDSIRNWDHVPFRSMPNIGELACFEMKMIGKQYAGELHVRFDEGEQLRSTAEPKRARSWKQRIQPRCGLKNDAPVLYSTSCRPSHEIASHLSIHYATVSRTSSS
jgi:Group II intron, maturase-specific domain